MIRTTAFCLAAACFLSAGSAVQASPINYSWGYQFVPSGHDTTLIASNNAAGVVSFAGFGHNNNMLTASGVTAEVSTPVWALSTASSSSPQSVDVPFALNLRLTDHASGLSGYVTFSGDLTGNISSSGSTLSPTFNSPLTQTVDLNHHLYTVTFNSFTAPQGSAHPGSVNFNVSVAHNPEPSSLVLAGIGAPLFGVILRRRRRAAC